MPPDQIPTVPARPTESDQVKLAQTILEADYKNLGKKVLAGKTLTATERTVVQARAEGGGDPSKVKPWATDQVELGEILGVTRKSILRWRKEGAPPPKADGRWSVLEWQEWMKANSKKGAKADEETGPSRQQLEARRILLMNDKLETEIGILRGDFVKVGDVVNQNRRLIAEARKIIESMPASLAPQVVGLTVPEAEKRLRAWVDEYCLALHTGKYH